MGKTRSHNDNDIVIKEIRNNDNDNDNVEEMSSNLQKDVPKEISKLKLGIIRENFDNCSRMVWQGGCEWTR
jgi:hypothetical protein